MEDTTTTRYMTPKPLVHRVETTATPTTLTPAVVAVATTGTVDPRAKTSSDAVGTTQEKVGGPGTATPPSDSWIEVVVWTAILIFCLALVYNLGARLVQSNPFQRFKQSVGFKGTNGIRGGFSSAAQVLC